MRTKVRRQTAVGALNTEKEMKVSSTGTSVYDLVVVGAGPSGLAVAERVAASGRKVCVIDPAPTSIWPNNYGVWIDEFEALGLEDCIDFTWNEATVFLDSDKESEKTLFRPYGRVDRKKLKTKFYEACLKHKVHFIETIAKDIKVRKTYGWGYTSVVCVFFFFYYYYCYYYYLLALILSLFFFLFAFFRPTRITRPQGRKHNRETPPIVGKTCS